MKAIINADDFGINEIVTSEIERMIEVGAVSSTTIMANGECLDEVKRFAIKHPEISFGVHLCLSEFSSITKSPILNKYGLTDENGRFITKAIFKINIFNEELKSAIKEELSAQIEKVQALGIPLSHCDSHHHVHTIFALKELFAEVLHKYRFKAIRRAVNYGSMRMKLHVANWSKNILLNKYYSKQFRTTDLFVSYQAFLKQCPNGNIVEMMCHPGHPGEQYKREMKLVENKMALAMPNIEMISYYDLQ